MRRYYYHNCDHKQHDEQCLVRDCADLYQDAYDEGYDDGQEDDENENWQAGYDEATAEIRKDLNISGSVPHDYIVIHHFDSVCIGTFTETCVTDVAINGICGTCRSAGWIFSR